MLKRSMLLPFLVIGCLSLYIVSGNQTVIQETIFKSESQKLHRLFHEIQHGIVYCYSGNSKTTGFFVSNDGWVLTAGHKVDQDFPGANKIYVILHRAKEENKETFESKIIIPPPQLVDLLLFKIDYKPKYYFQNFKKPNLFEENWIFGFRMHSGKVPSPSGFITGNTYFQLLLHTTASCMSGNSGSPVINRKGDVLGVLVRGYGQGDGLFVPSPFIEKYLEKIKEITKKGKSK